MAALLISSMLHRHCANAYSLLALQRLLPPELPCSPLPAASSPPSCAPLLAAPRQSISTERQASCSRLLVGRRHFSRPPLLPLLPASCARDHRPAMAGAFSRAFQAYSRQLERRPWRTQMITTGVLW